MNAIAIALPRLFIRLGYLSFRCFDGFVAALGGVVLAATLLPCQGGSALAFGLMGKLAIASLFFLQGARLSRTAILNGITHWRLHLMIAATTFLVFPSLGIATQTAMPEALPPLLWSGLMFACALPSTVQSSIALTSIARGNVAGAVCAATASNVCGILLTPILFGALASLRGGGGFNLAGLSGIVLQLLMPFIAGHLSRPRIGHWAEQNRSVLAITDRVSILLVVYTAFSGAVVHGIWTRLPVSVLESLGLTVALLLAATLSIAIMASRAIGLSASDEAAVVFCGSQKSLISAVPIASALFSGSTVGMLLLPIMLYYPMQLVIGAGLARWYGKADG